jgi:hypothetical protein
MKAKVKKPDEPARFRRPERDEWKRKGKDIKQKLQQVKSIEDAEEIEDYE